jgi:hypothetical protein
MKRILTIAITLGLVVLTVLVSWRLSNVYYAVFSLLLIAPLVRNTREMVTSRRRLAHVITALAIIPLACFWLLAAYSHPGWGLIVSVVLISWLATREVKLDRKVARETLRAKFSNTDPLILDFAIKSYYGYPHFTVVFRSEADLEKAKGNSLCQQIQIEVERLVPRLGGGPSFDPRVGIYYTTEAGVRGLVKQPVSLLHRLRSAIAGLFVGAVVGTFALYFFMLLSDSDFGLDSVRPGALLGAVLGFCLRLCFPQRG